MVVVELRPVFAEARLLDHFITTELVTELHWLVLAVQATVGEVDVAVTACAICLPTRDVFRPKLTLSKRVR